MNPARRHALASLAAATAAAAAWPALAAPAAAGEPGEPVIWPEVTLIDGRRWSAANVQGKTVVVVFWSTTCPFCQRHNVHVSRLLEASAGLPLEILTVARERDVAAVRRYLVQHSHRFAVTLDHVPMAAALSVRRLIPLTVTVDRAGRLQQVIPGEMSEDDVLGLAEGARAPGA